MASFEGILVSILNIFIRILFLKVLVFVLCISELFVFVFKYYSTPTLILSQG